MTSPMTLGNMRTNGVRTLTAWCLGQCSVCAVISAYIDHDAADGLACALALVPLLVGTAVASLPGCAGAFLSAAAAGADPAMASCAASPLGLDRDFIQCLL